MVIMVHHMLQYNVALINGIATFRLSVRLIGRCSRPGFLLADRSLEVLVRLIPILQAFFRLVAINCDWGWYEDIRAQGQTC